MTGSGRWRGYRYTLESGDTGEAWQGQSVRGAGRSRRAADAGQTPRGDDAGITPQAGLRHRPIGRIAGWHSRSLPRIA
jgi:hypothetical protein